MRTAITFGVVAVALFFDISLILANDLSRVDAQAKIKQSFAETSETSQFSHLQVVDQNCPYINEKTIQRGQAEISRRYPNLTNHGFIKVEHVGDIRTNSVGYYRIGAEFERNCPDARNDNDYYKTIRGTSRDSPNAHAAGYQYKSFYNSSFTDVARPSVLRTETAGFLEGINVATGRELRIPRLTSTMVIGRWKLGTVTGIFFPSENTAIAEYTVAFEPTAFGRVTGDSEKRETRSATFAKYDDGWRIRR
jgi:hypothetical protein